MTKIDTYSHLDADSRVTFDPTMQELAAKACALNYGAHRLLSAMVHELRDKQTTYIRLRTAEEATKSPSQRLYYLPDDERSPLADAIEAALNAGHTH